MGPLGVQEMIFIFVAALVIFGPKKLPELGKQLGKGMAEFRRATDELKDEFRQLEVEPPDVSAQATEKDDPLIATPVDSSTAPPIPSSEPREPRSS